MARRILVVTKSSARAQWGREFREWGFDRTVQVVYTSADRIAADAEVVVVGWGMVFSEALIIQLLDRSWDVLLLDESHEAKNMVTQRTIAAYGLAPRARHVWCLSGTPVPNAPNDLYPMLHHLDPARLGGMDEDAFIRRYCVVKTRRINGVMRNVVKGGKNLEELNERLRGLWLRRTQKDVGIRPPIFSVFALHVDKLPAELAEDDKAQLIFDAIETGETKSLEMHLGPLRRITGTIKAHAVVEAARELLQDRQIDKLVLMGWHKDVLALLWNGLTQFGVVGITGETDPTKRDGIARSFREDASKRVFVGQIQAAGEAIDLSAAAELWFVEPSFVPKDMSQAAMRITNHSQKRQALVRVCALEGSIDEALMSILTRKVATIRQIMEPT